jgi:hypothetical protein
MTQRQGGEEESNVDPHPPRSVARHDDMTRENCRKKKLKNERKQKEMKEGVRTICRTPPVPIFRYYQLDGL